METNLIKDSVDECARYPSIDEKAIQQVLDESLNSVLGADNRELEVDKHPKRTVTRVQRESQEREESWLKTTMNIRMIAAFSLVVFASLSGLVAMSQTPQEPQPFPSPKLEPPIVTPGKTDRDPPSDAIVLFDGKELTKWRAVRGGGDPTWKIKDGYVEVAPRTGDIATKQEFGDCQLHIEWAAPSEVKGEGQERGNSGVFLMERYEVQVLDSFDNKTYYHGQAGAVYKQHAPLVNASRKPGEWQTYDIIFKAPRFDEQGKVIERARVSVLHIGVLVQNNVELYGNTFHDRPALYIAHPPKASLKLQDHGDLVRYRNIWIRPL